MNAFPPAENPHDAEAIIQAMYREPWPVEDVPHILATHNGVIDLRPYLPPITQAALRVVTETASFVDLVNIDANPQSMIFASRQRGAFVTVIDYGTTKNPTRDEHQIVYQPEKDPVWLAWANLHNKPVDQHAFADFIEEHLDSIVSPPGADLLELVQDIKGHKNVTFRNAQRLDNGETKINYDETVGASGSKGSLTIPNTISVTTPIFRGEGTVTFDAFLRYRITNDGGLYFTVKIKREDDIVPEAFGEIRKNIDRNVSQPVIEGWYQ